MRLLFVLLLVIGSTASMAQSEGDYRTDQAGLWSATTTWQIFTGGSWTNLELTAFPIPTDASGAINLLFNGNITVATSVSADEVTLSAGTLTISGGETFSILDGPGNDFVNLGGIVTTNGTFSIASNADYEHARNGGTIPLTTWGINSTCLVTGITANNPTLIPANAYENFIWDCASQSGARSLGGNLQTVNGDLLISNTNNLLLNLGTTVAYTLNIAGDFIVTGNSIIRLCSSANPGPVINVAGNFDYSSSAVSASSFKTSGSYTLNV